MRSTLLAVSLILAAALAPAATRADVVYGRAGGVELKLDLVQPEGPGPFPAVLCIHGGAWSSGSKSGYGPVLGIIAQSGYVGVSIEYRFAPVYRFPAQIDDIRQAVAYLRAHAAELKIDTGRMAVMGDSAGGHLALLLALKYQEPGLRAVVSLAGPTDLTRWQAAPEGEKLLKVTSDQLLEAVFGTHDRSSSVLKDASPLTFAAQSKAAVLTIHGDADPVVKLEQAEWLHQALRKAGVDEKLLVLKGAGHGFQGQDLQTATAAVFEFLAGHLRPAGKAQ